MILIGEKLNSSIPSTLEKMRARDMDGLARIIERQAEAGADYLDLNTAMLGDAEGDMLCALVELVRAHAGCGVVLDSPSPRVLIEAAAVAEGMPIIFNSITAAERGDELIPVAAERGAGVVVLPMRDKMPETAAERVRIAKDVYARLADAGVKEDEIYIDGIVETLSSGDGRPGVALDTARRVKAELPRARALLGLSNVSFGLPGRARLNAAYLAMAIAGGVDAVIMDVLSEPMREALRCAMALAGRDEYCMDYIRYMRTKG